MLRDTYKVYFYLCNTSNWNSRLTFPLGHMTHKGETTPVFCHSYNFCNTESNESESCIHYTSVNP